jgi:hypothetical protein
VEIRKPVFLTKLVVLAGLLFFYEPIITALDSVVLEVLNLLPIQMFIFLAQQEHLQMCLTGVMEQIIRHFSFYNFINFL